MKTFRELIAVAGLVFAAAAVADDGAEWDGIAGGVGRVVPAGDVGRGIWDLRGLCEEWLEGGGRLKLSGSFDSLRFAQDDVGLGDPEKTEVPKDGTSVSMESTLRFIAAEEAGHYPASNGDRAMLRGG